MDIHTVNEKHLWYNDRISEWRKQRSLENRMQPVYTKLRVNNEVELCDIFDVTAKQQIEHAFLQNRISYYMKWPKRGFFRRPKQLCTICVNENSKEKAEAVIKALGTEVNDRVKFILKKSTNDYL